MAKLSTQVSRIIRRGWPNGDCSVVQAQTKQDAIVKLDELDNAERCPLIKLDECQIHFRLTDEGQLELQSLGEETESGIWNFCYPVLDGVLTDKAREHWSATEREAVHQAVKQERDRVRSADVPEPETALGRDIKAKMGAPTALVDEMVRQEGRETLRKLKPPRKIH